MNDTKAKTEVAGYRDLMGLVLVALWIQTSALFTVIVWNGDLGRLLIELLSR